MVNKTLNIPFVLATDPGDHRDPTGYMHVNHKELSIFENGQGPSVLAKVRKRLTAAIEEGLRAVKHNAKRKYLGCADGTVLAVSWRFDSWQYDIAGPGRQFASSCGGGYASFEGCVESAKKHAEGSYGGVIWTC